MGTLPESFRFESYLESNRLSHEPTPPTLKPYGMPCSIGAVSLPVKIQNEESNFAVLSHEFHQFQFQ